MFRELDIREQFYFAKNNYTNWLPRNPDENMFVQFMMDIYRSSEKIKESSSEVGVNHFNRGNKLYSQGDFRGAISSYTASFKVYPMCDTFLNLSMSFAKIKQYTHGLQISCDALAIADYLDIEDKLPVIYFQRGAIMAELLDSAWELSIANTELVEFALDNFRQAEALGVPQARQYIKNIMDVLA
ncbi:hypothetical protein [Runella slithyformis]|uniref:Tetratricopeptide repeat protein n=1 Tax=Runella slithyformis (strain ATCC 29530 / DSM 19594 / LMG 11500 / NCIMB 11436 / LSU 4) TaxID=761193 RepID=A0A7U3ZRN6_RUNSL|nr:hypothetical protein [Runella slithyformis]AEI52120.1 hypothetical protein Runsl_5823 [Runella slithyformis DSM 19594]